MTPLQVLTAIAPAYAANPSVGVFLDMAEQRTSACTFGQKRAQAVAFLAAHMMALTTDPARAGGSGGAITSKKEGDLAVSYGAANSKSNDDAELSQTSYGQMLLGLVRGSVAFVGVSGDVSGGCRGLY